VENVLAHIPHWKKAGYS